MEAFKRLAGKMIPVFRVLLGVMFVYAGVVKLMDVSAFAAQVGRFGIESTAVASVIAGYLPFLEIACGIALVVRRFSLGATILYFSLLIAFETALIFAWLSGYDGSCGCFGRFFGGASVQAAFFRNLGLLAVAAVLLVREISFGRRTVE